MWINATAAWTNDGQVNISGNIPDWQKTYPEGPILCFGGLVNSSIEPNADGTFTTTAAPLCTTPGPTVVVWLDTFPCDTPVVLVPAEPPSGT